MATRSRARKKKTSRKAARRKSPTRKKGVGRKATRKKTARRKSTPKKASRRKGARKKVVRKKSSRKPARRRAAARRVSAAETLARKIVSATTGDASQFPLRELYAEDCTSTEAGGVTVRGYAGLEGKLRQWEAMQEQTHWKPRNVLINDDTICIEWDADVKLRDGRVVQLRETAVHDVKDGKIVAERYYYDPGALAPPATETSAAPTS